MFILIGLLIIAMILLIVAMTVLIGLHIMVNKPVKAEIPTEPDDDETKQMERLQEQFANMMAYTGVTQDD